MLCCIYIDTSRPVCEEEKTLLELFWGKKVYDGPVVIALNKCDLLQNHLAAIRNTLKAYKLTDEPLTVSRLTGDGTEELLAKLLSLMPESEPLYPDEIYTDQDPEFRITEIIREKAVNKSRQELPHAIDEEVADMEMKGQSLWIRGFIFVERESQKGILVGKQGRIIKAIVNESIEELKALFPYPVKLDPRVQVKPKWRKKDHLLKKLIK